MQQAIQRQSVPGCERRGMRRAGWRAALRLWVLACVVLLAAPAHAGAYEDFLVAVKRDDVLTVERLLARGFDPNAVDPEGVPVLVLAMREQAYRVGQVLARQPQIAIDRASPIGETALMVAAHRGSLELARALVARGAQVNRPAWAPLHYAAAGGHVEMARWLLEQSAYIDAESPNGTTPLMMAARQKQISVLRLLLEEGADPTVRNQSGLTARDYLDRLGERDAAEVVQAAADAFRRRQGGASSTQESSRRGAGTAGEARASDAAIAPRLPGERPAASGR